MGQSHAFSLALVFAGLTAQGCASPPTARTCVSDVNCLRGERCVDSVCVPRLDAAPQDLGAGTVDSAAPDSDPARPDVRAPADARPPPGDATCVALESEARLIRRPVDLVLLVDTSPSTGAAATRVGAELNAQLARILDAAGIDYRVVLFAPGVTIDAPLATSGRLLRINVGVGSSDAGAFKPVLDSLPSWQPFLRPGVEKVFMQFTDSTPVFGDGLVIEGYASTFDRELYRLDPANFGTETSSLITYHAVVGLGVRAADPTRPYDAAEPLVTETCTSPDIAGALGAGPGFQQLAVRTGGVRFPICLFANFDVLFRLIADSVIDVATVDCSFELPAPPPGTELDLDTVVVRYMSGSASRGGFRRAASGAACTEAGFLIEGGRLSLCPAACARVEADPQASLSLAFGCDSIPF